MALAHLLKGDQVVVVGGKERGKRGTVQRVDVGSKRVFVERVNLIKRHVKPSQKHPQGGIVEKEGSIDVSNVRLWCGKCQAARRSKTRQDGGKKTRICTKCETAFEKAS